MGNEPSKPSVDLLPPKFTTTTDTHTRLLSSPFSYLFGAEDRRTVFGGYFPQSTTRDGFGATAVHMQFAPDFDEKTLVEFMTDMELADTRHHPSNDTVTSVSQLALKMSRSFSPSDAPAWLNLTSGRASVALGTKSLVVEGSALCQYIGLAARAVSPAVDGGSVGLAGTVRFLDPAGRFSVGATALPSGAVSAWALSSPSSSVVMGAEYDVYHPDRGLEDVKDNLCLSVSLKQDPTYEMSLGVDKGELVGGYVHKMSVRRRVMNPLEERHVKGIYNMIDVAAELRRPLLPPSNANAQSLSDSKATVGLSWQMNKAVMVKAKVGTHESGVALAFRSWFDPVVTVGVSALVDHHSKSRSADPKLGLTLSVVRGGMRHEYQQPVRYQQRAAHSKKYRAAPDGDESQPVQPRDAVYATPNPGPPPSAAPSPPPRNPLI